MGTAWLRPPALAKGVEGWESGLESCRRDGRSKEQPLPRNSPSLTLGPGCVLGWAEQSQTQRGRALGPSGSRWVQGRRSWDGLRFCGISAGAGPSRDEGPRLRSRNTTPWDCPSWPWGLAAEPLQVLWVQDEQEPLLGSVCPWLWVHPARGCVLDAKGPDLCWSTRLYSILPGSPTPVAAHAVTVCKSPLVLVGYREYRGS